MHANSAQACAADPAKRNHRPELPDALKRPLAIVGVYPPPFGGVGVGLMRLLPFLDEAGIDYVLYNTGPSRTEHPRILDVGWSKRWMLSLLLRSRHQVIHFGTSRWQARVLAAMINRLRKAQVVLYAHGYSLPDSFFKGGGLQRWLVRWTLRRTARVFATNPDLKVRIGEIGFDPARIDVVPAFIPPHDAPDARKIPEDVQRFCADKSPILSANGAFVTFNGADVYGLRAMADLVERLLPQHPRIALVVFMRRGAHREMEEFRDLIDRLQTPPLREHMLLYDSSGDFVPMLGITDVFLRATSTDGDANSIREALQFGVPVVASDVVPRAEGVRLYRGGSLEALAAALEAVLENLPGERSAAAAAPKYSAADLIIPIYRELLGGQDRRVQPTGGRGRPTTAEKLR